MATTDLSGLGALVGGGLGLLSSAQTPLNLQGISQGGVQGQQGLQNILSGGIQPGVNQNVLQSYQNPYLQNAIQAANYGPTQQFQNQTLPQISDVFANAGSFGSGRQAALTGTATQNLTQQLNNNAAQLSNNAYNAAFQAAANAGTQQYAGQANAANSLYSPATQIAGESPLLSAITGASTGSGLANALATGNFGNLGQAVSGAGSALAGGVSSVLSKLGLSSPSGPGTTLSDGSTQYQTADGGSVIQDQQGNVYVKGADGTTQSFDAQGQPITQTFDAGALGQAGPPVPLPEIPAPAIAPVDTSSFSGSIGDWSI